MVAVTGLVFHSVESPERLLPAVFLIFRQQEGQAEYTGFVFIGVKTGRSLKKCTGYDDVVQQSPFSLIFVAAGALTLGGFAGE